MHIWLCKGSINCKAKDAYLALQAECYVWMLGPIPLDVLGPTDTTKEGECVACYHPLVAYIVGKDRNTGKNILKFNVTPDWMLKHPETRIELPCGRCIGCRLEYSRQWANRCMLELKYHDSAYFCTFTYDDAHVPISYHASKDTGEAFPGMTLRKRDMQLAMKRIRKAFPDDRIRFFGAGEYGSNTFRPHYHYILFGLHLDDLVFYKKTELGFDLYNSSKLSRCWCTHDGTPLGYVVVGRVNWDTCAYVARYTSKKWSVNDNEVYRSLGLEEPFTLMSRRPGIGRLYYEDHPDLYQYDFINVSTEKGGKKFYPPKYFDNLLEKDNPELYQEIKERRRENAIRIDEVKERNSNLDKYDRLALAERIKAGQIKSLRRNKI